MDKPQEAPMKLLASLVALMASAQAQETKFSGPQKGEPLPGFKVQDVTGPFAGQQVDYIEKLAGAPTVVVFVHHVTRQGHRLVTAVDRIVQERADLGLKGLIVFLDDDATARERLIPHYQRPLGVQSPMAISVDGAEGPGTYGLNKEMELTILLAKENKVVHNMALIGPNETYAAEFEKAVDALLPPPELSPQEMAREIRRLQAEVRRLRRELDELKRGPQGEMKRKP
jgi:hypothetical protein